MPLLEAFADAVGALDRETLMELLHPDTSFVMIPDWPDGGEFHGREQSAHSTAVIPFAPARTPTPHCPRWLVVAAVVCLSSVGPTFLKLSSSVSRIEFV